MQVIDIPISELIPHAPPMILIDAIEQYQPDHVVCRVDISLKSFLYNESHHGVPAYVAIEYMAQTIGVLAGIEARQRNGAIKLGFLLGTRRCSLPTSGWFINGAVLFVAATREWQEDSSGLAVFDCAITDSSGARLAQGKLNVFQPEDVESFFRDSDDE